MAEHAAPNHGRRRGAKIDAEKKIGESWSRFFPYLVFSRALARGTT